MNQAAQHSIEAEKGILGSILLDPNVFEECARQIGTEHFHTPAHRTIYSVIAELLSNKKLSPHEKLLIPLTIALDERKLLSSVGGAGYVTELFNFVPTAANIEYYIETVHEKAALRGLIRAAEEMARRAQAAEASPEEIIAFTENELHRIHGLNGKHRSDWLTSIDKGTVKSSELASMALPKREPLLLPFLNEGDYGIIYAPRGVGKTWLGLLIAKAVATGGRVGEWIAPAAAKVLYVDGEMPPDLMRDRDKGLGEGEIEFLNHAIFFDRTQKLINITEPSLQEAILKRSIRDEIRLIVLDNLSTVASGIKENDSFEWERLHNWLLQFRRHKIAVILEAHAGRNGEVRGTSKREDAAFWVMALDDAKKYSDDKRGARFISRFTKPSRNTQEEVPPLEWHIVTDSVTGEVSAGCKPAQGIDVFRRLIEEGVTECSQIADEMRVSPATVSRMAKKGMDAGWLRKKGREYELAGVGLGDEELRNE